MRVSSSTEAGLSQPPIIRHHTARWCQPRRQGPNSSAAVCASTALAACLALVGIRWTDLDPPKRLAYADLAFRDSYRCLEVFPEWNAAYPLHSQNTVYVAVLGGRGEWLRDALKMVNRLVSDDWMNEPLSGIERAFALNVRAQCHHFLGELAEAEKDYAESIRLAPDQPSWYVNRARFWEQRDRKDLAEADRQKAQTLTNARQSGHARDAGSLQIPAPVGPNVDFRTLK
jgi:tetratricopeptide (TPR) repeat protein